MNEPMKSPRLYPTIIDRQLDQAWLGWLADKQQALRVFFDSDVPQMPADRYSTAGLDIAESALLERCTGPDTRVDGAMLDRFGCFVGEVFVQSLAGFWINSPLGPPQIRPTVRFLYADITISLEAQIYFAVRRRTGHQWADLHAIVSEYCAEWWQSGHGLLG